MTRRTLLAACIAVSVGALGAIGTTLLHDRVPPPRQAVERPTLALLTSLPLVFGESFGIDSGGSPALTRLEQRYKVMPIAAADAASLKGQRLLLMVQPRAQPAEVLVELDRWVREGGRLLLLADPKLDWPSERPLGDVLRPPPTFADTGLLEHWGLKLSAPGTLESSGACHIGNDGLIAHCRIGQGLAVVIADADFINVDDRDVVGLDRLIVELAQLETR